MTRVLVPGSFDPITHGHMDIITRCSALFDEVVVGVGDNLAKRYLFSRHKRVELARQSVAQLDNVMVQPIDGLLATWCQEHHIDVIAKGLRSAMDASFELPQATVNRNLADIETILLATHPSLAHVSSTIVKEVAANGGDVSAMVDTHVSDALMSTILASSGGDGAHDE
ncbi:MAG: pantetheine-phosphate adenylyltransferase [Actinomycetaceae bacterium]|nr:pantetheine-phosphate adenylyltransferase [Actinomycetaceae bacterium]